MMNGLSKMWKNAEVSVGGTDFNGSVIQVVG
jgi:hypothetical protein